jgi:hypothetical protein
MINISIDPEAIELLKKTLREFPDKVPVAISRAINDASRSAVTIMDREIRGRYNVKSSDVRPGIKRSNASPEKLESTVKISGARFPLFKFGIVARRNDLVVIEEVKHRRTELQHYFVAIMDSGHAGIFRRTGDKHRMKGGRSAGRVREGIAELTGKARSQMMEARTVAPKILEKAGEVLSTRMNHHAEFLLKEAQETLKNSAALKP